MTKESQRRRNSNTGIFIYDEARTFKERYSFPYLRIASVALGIVVNTNSP